MNNTIKNKYFNEEIKNAFLDFIQNDYKSVDSYKTMFQQSSEYELKLNKDLYDFSMIEIKEFAMSLGRSSVASVNNLLSHIKTYLTWGAKYSQSNLDAFDGVNIKDISKSLTVNYKNNLYTREEILDMCDSLDSAMDAALILAPFEGIKGRNMYELRSMREKDLYTIDDNRYFITLRNLNLNEEETSRELEISKDLYQFIKLACREEEYVLPAKMGSRSQPLANTEYVFRTLRRRTQNDENVKVESSFISRKYTKLKETLGEKTFKIMDVFNSGIAHEINERVVDGVLNKSNALIIAERFRTIPERYKFQEDVNKKQYIQKYGEVEVIF